MIALARLAWAPLGGRRSQLCWRALGFAMLQVSLLEWTASTVAGAVLVVFGPRLATLAFAFVAIGAFLSDFAVTDVESGIPEEFGPFLALLAFALVAAGALLARVHGRLDGARGARIDDATARAIDDAFAALFRIGAVLAMGFSAFHKLNADFFDGDLSCATLLGDHLDRVWRLPLTDFGVLPTPSTVVLGEALSPVLLLLWPAIGLVYTVAVMTPVGLFGPTALTATIYAMAFGCLRATDVEIVWQGMRGHAVAAALAVLAIWGATWVLYIGQQPLRFYTYGLEVALIGVGAAVLLAAKGGVRRPGLLPPRGSGRAVAVVFALVVFASSLAPYLGAKYRMSFAMFSNLRVDSTRWNHWLVPRAVRLVEHDPYVRVDVVRFDARTRQRQAALARPGERALTPALLTPMSLAHRLDQLRAMQGRGRLELVYRGDTRVFEDAANDPELTTWLAGMPHHKLFQSSLVASGGQPCIH